MREILFRGKTENGVWVEGFYIESEYHNDRNLYRIVEEDNWCDEYEGYYYNEYDVIPETVGQFTGLTDKNGNKIFEGDIVKTHYANAPKSDFIETVVFHNGKFCAFHENNDCKQWAILYDGTPHLRIDKSVYMNSVEVIGNIHDNPELISGDSNAD